MAINWPQTLPCMLLGSVFEPVDPQLRTPLQNGRTFTRLNYTAVPENFQASWVMDDAQGAAFENFYWNTLVAGTLWFNMPVWLPQTKGNRLVRFLGAFTREQYTGGKSTDCVLWRYNANMEHYLRFGLPTDGE